MGCVEKNEQYPKIIYDLNGKMVIKALELGIPYL
jgi:hypothetical protein